jgi:hypothetical protein
VTALAAAHNEKQYVNQGGNARRSIFHFLRRPPAVTLMIDIEPDEIAKGTEAELIRDELCIARAIGFPRPVKWIDVTAGLYILNLHRKDSPILQKPISAKPPSHIERLRLR